MTSTREFVEFSKDDKERLKVDVEEYWRDAVYDELLANVYPDVDDEDAAYRAALATLAIALEQDDDVQVFAEEHEVDDIEMLAGWAADMYGRNIARALAMDYLRHAADMVDDYSHEAEHKSRLTRKASADALTADEELYEQLLDLMDDILRNKAKLRELVNDMTPADNSAEEICLAACDVAVNELAASEVVDYASTKTSTPPTEVAWYAVTEFGDELVDTLTRMYLGDN